MIGDGWRGWPDRFKLSRLRPITIVGRMVRMMETTAPSVWLAAYAQHHHHLDPDEALELGRAVLAAHGREEPSRASMLVLFGDVDAAVAVADDDDNPDAPIPMRLRR